MLKSKYDQQIEKLMNEQGLSHAEAMAQVNLKPKKAAPAEGSPEEEAAETPEEESTEDTELVDLPAGLVPGAAIGKEVDISVTGIVKSKSGGMVSVEVSRTSGSSREPMKPPTLSNEVPR